MKTEIDYDDYIDNLLNIINIIDTSKVTILTGRNAGGKSLIRKQLSIKLRERLGRKVFIPHASQQLRTEVNSERMGLTQDLEWLATSSSTINLIQRVFNQSKADYIVIDEPEIGVGEELQLGLCDYINEKLKNRTCGILIICHSRIMVKNIVHDNFINLEGLSEQEWLNRVPKKISVEEFELFSSGLFFAIRDRQKQK